MSSYEYEDEYEYEHDGGYFYSESGYDDDYFYSESGYDDGDDYFYSESEIGEGEYRYSVDLGTGGVTRLYDDDGDGTLDRFETWAQDGIELEGHGSIAYGQNNTVTLTGQGIGGSTLYAGQAKLIYTDSVLTGINPSTSTTGLMQTSLIDFDDVWGDSDGFSSRGHNDFDDLEYHAERETDDYHYLSSVKMDAATASVRDEMHLYDRDTDGAPDYYETIWEDTNGVTHREHGQVVVNADGTATLTASGMGGATLHRETVDLAYDAQGQLTGLVSGTVAGSSISAGRMGLIDFDDVWGDTDGVSGHGHDDLDDLEFHLEREADDGHYLASVKMDAATASVRDEMHLYDRDTDGVPDYYETAWEDGNRVTHREHGQIVVNADGTATLTAPGMGGATLHRETVDLAYDAQGQLTGLVSGSVAGSSISAGRMGLIDFDDVGHGTLSEGHEFEDLYYDHAQAPNQSGYLSSLRIVDGDDTRLYDDDGDGIPDRFTSSWTQGGREQIEHGIVSLGASNTITLSGQDDAGTTLFTETAGMALDADGQLVGITMAATGGTRATAVVKTWDDGHSLQGVDFDDGHATDALGEAAFHRLTAASDFAVAPTASSALLQGASAAVDLTDAIAILKMMVGLNQPKSGYQVAAADMDSSGKVDLQDAIGLLKHVVGLAAPTPEWVFAPAGAAIANVDTLEIHYAFDAHITQDVGTDSIVEIFGILRGDVDGSWG